jgi:predicted DNA-binding protein YlxM (UPF0122 family)
MIDPRITDLAAEVLTYKQLCVWDLYHHRGMSFRAIATHLDLGRTTVTDRYDNACRTLRRHGVTFTPDGHPHLETENVA